jgi:tetratricopeptide (TPR) repeat protein
VSFEPGTLIGRFVVLAPLGAGGMGIVHLAYDPKLDRKIALKFLHEQSADRTARLLREAQALGRLSHPNVVAIHDVGTHDEHVWLAMEYVEGETLTAWVGSGSRTRPWRSVLELLLAAGGGVAAVHAAGLVHRDLKPSNFMIGKDGRVRLMDFGLVRGVVKEDDPSSPSASTSASSKELYTTLTQSGELIGTPAYMTPEQFLGHGVDARTDQFSFCVVAWRALYGQRPFAGESVAELRYAVIRGRRRPPPRGSRVPSWLRDVIARGLAVDPADRWPSMQALLDALASGRRRARVRRLAAGLAGIAMLGVAGYGYERWDHARAVAEQVAACEAEGRAIDEVWNDEVCANLEQAFASSESPIADDVWARVRPRLDDYAKGWAEARTQACNESEVEGVRTRESAEFARSCLDERRTTLAEYTKILGGIEANRVSTSLTTLARLEPPATCLDPHTLARRIPAPDEPQTRARVEALREQLARIDALVQMRMLDDADREATSAYAEAQALGWPPIEAEAGFRLGAAKLSRSENVAAAEILEHTMFLAAEQGHDALAVDAAAYLVFSAYEQGQHQDGLRWGRFGSTIVARSEVDLALAEAHLLHGIASVHEGIGALDESMALWERVIATYERTLPADHPDMGAALVSACLVEGKRGRLESAVALCQRSLDIVNKSLPANHSVRSQVLNIMGSLYLDAGEPKRALPYFHDGLAIAEATLPADHPDLGHFYCNIGASHLLNGDADEALPELDRALELFTRVLTPDNAILGYPLEIKGRALTELGRLPEAIELLERAVAVRSGENGNPTLASMSRYYLARALVADPATHARALEVARQALQGLRDSGGSPEQIATVEGWLTEQEANRTAP